jgi:hypothetical protein
LRGKPPEAEAVVITGHSLSGRVGRGFEVFDSAVEVESQVIGLSPAQPTSRAAVHLHRMVDSGSVAGFHLQTYRFGHKAPINTNPRVIAHFQYKDQPQNLIKAKKKDENKFQYDWTPRPDDDKITFHLCLIVIIKSI